MPPRSKRIFHDDNTRKKIQAAQIINRLNGHINGEVDLSPTQVSAAKILLNKVLPDLQSIEGNLQVDHQVKEVETRIVKAPEPPKLVHEANN